MKKFISIPLIFFWQIEKRKRYVVIKLVTSVWSLLVLAVTLHNIPEGIAFLYGVLSGVVGPIGVILTILAAGFTVMMVLDVALG